MQRHLHRTGILLPPQPFVMSALHRTVFTDSLHREEASTPLTPSPWEVPDFCPNSVQIPSATADSVHPPLQPSSSHASAPPELPPEAEGTMIKFPSACPQGPLGLSFPCIISETEVEKGKPSKGTESHPSPDKYVLNFKAPWHVHVAISIPFHWDTI